MKCEPKLYLLMAIFLLFVAVPQAKADPNEDKLKKKLAKPFVAKGGWEADFTKARKEAIAANKPFFIYFTRSYSP